MRVLQGALEPRQRSTLETAYEHFRLERQGDLVSPATLENYDYLGPRRQWTDLIVDNPAIGPS